MLDVQYDYAAIAKRVTRRSLAKRAECLHWRYRELLPNREGWNCECFSATLRYKQP
jgi:hypothetical protein